jgi:hypothetical protein
MLIQYFVLIIDPRAAGFDVGSRVYVSVILSEYIILRFTGFFRRLTITFYVSVCMIGQINHSRICITLLFYIRNV